MNCVGDPSPARVLRALDSLTVSGGVFLLRGEDDLVPMIEAPYDSEDVLQRLLAKFPDLLAGDQMGGGEARRWLLIGASLQYPS